MLPPNLLIVLMVVFLATAASTAPVEEKEREEVELEATEEGELSEEEEDDDDSKSQDKIEGVLGRLETTTAAASGGSVSGASAAGEGTKHGAAGSSADSAEAAAKPSGVSTGHTQPAGSDGVRSESNGNGQKLLNGGGGGRADSLTVIIDPPSHDFLLGLMGGGGPFSPDVSVTVPGLISVISSDVTAAPSADQSHSSSPDSPADPASHVDSSLSQSGPYHTLGSKPGQSLSSSVSGSSHFSVHASSPSSHREQTGNGRQTLLTDTNRATDRLVSFSDLQTQTLKSDLTGGAESVTSLRISLTASVLGLGHDVTESAPVVLITDSVDAFTPTLNSVLGVNSNTEMVTMATGLIGSDTVSAAQTGSPLDSSHPAVTDQNQMAGPVTEQYNPSGQGPEGAENVELEDTC
ncbi:uncharacterized protein LOC113126151 isoform X2 [Mastacembelus armatus]|uniref:uncharacterized protein LOC113126151 isoform X2 n=1 Tax=Mastacembelus armatus TaxID=205130 RepID=UPI000E459D62|nr:uncharacterized protein LOC113126151 isoform X2 [Mastacembelus armatus]